MRRRSGESKEFHSDLCSEANQLGGFSFQGEMFECNSGIFEKPDLQTIEVYCTFNSACG